MVKVYFTTFQRFSFNMDSKIKDDVYPHNLKLADEYGQLTEKYTVLYAGSSNYRCPIKSSDTFDPVKVYGFPGIPYLPDYDMPTSEISKQMHEYSGRLVFIQELDCKYLKILVDNKIPFYDCGSTCGDSSCWGTYFDPYVILEVNVHKSAGGLLSDMKISYVFTNMSGEDEQIGDPIEGTLTLIEFENKKCREFVALGYHWDDVIGEIHQTTSFIYVNPITQEE